MRRILATSKIAKLVEAESLMFMSSIFVEEVMVRSKLKELDQSHMGRPKSSVVSGRCEGSL